MDAFLTVVSGLAWTIVYIEAIRVGLRDRTYAMPLVALGLNFAWESIYTWQQLSNGPSLQGFVNLAWVVADLFVVYTFLRFGRAELPGFVTGPMFAGLAVLVFGVSFAVQSLFIGEFGVSAAARYSAFLQNLLMSALFIAMLAARRGTRGQSLTIATAKWLGTLAPTILFGVIEHSPFILGIGVMCGVLDLVYIGLYLWVRARPATAPA